MLIALNRCKPRQRVPNEIKKSFDLPVFCVSMFTTLVYLCTVSILPMLATVVVLHSFQNPRSFERAILPSFQTLLSLCHSNEQGNLLTRHSFVRLCCRFCNAKTGFL